MPEIDELKIVVTADTKDVNEKLKSLQSTLKTASKPIQDFGNKMNTTGIQKSFQNVTKSLKNEEAQIKQIAQKMAKEFIESFNIKDEDIQKRIGDLSEKVLSGYKRNGLKVYKALDVESDQQELVGTLQSFGRVLKREITEDKKVLADFYDTFYSMGKIKLPKGMKNPALEGYKVSGSKFGKEGIDLTQSNVLTDYFPELFSEIDMMSQENMIERILQLLDEYKKKVEYEVPLSVDEVDYAWERIIESTNEANDVLKQPLNQFKEYKKQFADFGKDWTFDGNITQLENKLKSFEQQLVDARVAMQKFVLTDEMSGTGFKNAVANVELLTNKIAYLKGKINDINESERMKKEMEELASQKQEEAMLSIFQSKLKNFQDLAEHGISEIYSDDGGALGTLSDQVSYYMNELKEKLPQAQSLIEQYSSLYDKLSIPFIPPETPVLDIPEENIVNDTEQAITKLDRLKEKLSEVGVIANKFLVGVGLKKYSDDVVLINKQIEDTEKKITRINEKIEETNKLADGKSKDKALERYNAQLDVAIEKTQRLNEEKAKLLSSRQGYASNAGDFTKQVSKNVKSLESGFSKFNKILKNVASFSKKVSNIISSVFSKMIQPIKKLSSNMGHLDKKTSSLTDKFKFLTRTMQMMLVFKLWIVMSEGITTGMQNLVQFSDRCNQSFSLLRNSLIQLKNSFAAAVAPLLNAFAPALNQIIQLCIRATNAVNQLLAALTGQSSWIRAKQINEDYAKSLSKVNKQLLALDELNNLSTSGDTGTKPKDMFEEEGIDTFWIDLAAKIKEVASSLFAPIKAAWEKVGKYVTDSWKNALKNIWYLIKSIGKDFIDVWNQDETIAIMEELLHIIGDIGSIVASLAFHFRMAWDENERGKKILEGIRDIIGIVVSGFHNIVEETLNWTRNLDFGPLLESIKNYIESLNPVIQFLADVLSSFYIKVLLPLGEWVLEKGLPQLFNILSKLNDAIEWDFLNSRLQEFWEHLEPFGETIGQGLVIFVERISEKLSNWLQESGYEVFDKWLGSIEEWMDNTTPEDLADRLEGLLDKLTSLAGVIKDVADAIVGLVAGDNLSDAIGNVENLAIGLLAVKGACGLLVGASGIVDLIEKFGKLGKAAGGASSALGTGGAVAGAGSLAAGAGAAVAGGSLTTALYCVEGGILATIAAAGGFTVGEKISTEFLKGETYGMSFLEQMNYIKDSFTDGSWKGALKLWGKDIKEIFTGSNDEVDKNSDKIKDAGSSIRKTSDETSVAFSRDVNKIDVNTKTSMKNLSNTIDTASKNFTKNTDVMSKSASTSANQITKSFYYAGNNSFASMQSSANGIKSIFNNANNWYFPSVVNGLVNTFNDAANQISRISFRMATDISTTINAHSYLRSYPAYASGGMPEDGFFYANSSELVGRFANGRTAVANNEQIVSGIKEGVKAAISEELSYYLSSLVASNQEIANKDMSISDDALFRSVKRSAKNFKQSTGIQPF